MAYGAMHTAGAYMHSSDGSNTNRPIVTNDLSIYII